MDITEAEPEQFILPDGRRLSYRSYGATSGRPVIALHGTPGFGLKFGFAASAAHAQGITLICPDRWGYGQSDAPPRKSQSLVGYGEDIEHLADAKNFDDFALIGVSGGGPFAVGAAAHLQDRVTALGLIAPVGPIVWERDDGGQGVASMTAFHHFCFRALPRIPGAVETLFAGFGVVSRRLPNLAMAVATARAAPADRELMRDEAERRCQAKVFGGGLMGGATGPGMDLRLFSQPWQIDFEKVSAATQIWQGLDDRNVPVSASERLAQIIPGAGFTAIEKAGHCWVAKNISTVLSWLKNGSDNS